MDLSTFGDFGKELPPELTPLVELLLVEMKLLRGDTADAIPLTSFFSNVVSTLIRRIL